MNANGNAPQVEITTEMLHELFRRMPAAGEMLRVIMLESENAALRGRLEALGGDSEVEAVAESE